MRLSWIGIGFMVLTGTLVLTGASAASLSQEDDGASGNLWGGRDIAMQATARGATVEFDCAHGSIVEPIKANAKGEFVARGTYTPERGGPVTLANPPRDLPATYKGSIDGDTMHLQVELADKDQQPPPFTLSRGQPGRVRKCR